MFVKFVERCFWTCVFNLLSQWTCKKMVFKNCEGTGLVVKVEYPNGFQGLLTSVLRTAKLAFPLVRSPCVGWFSGKMLRPLTTQQRVRSLRGTFVNKRLSGL